MFWITRQQYREELPRTGILSQVLAQHLCDEQIDVGNLRMLWKALVEPFDQRQRLTVFPTTTSRRSD